MRFLVNMTAPEATFYIDFARELSKMTRSMNRQFRDYTIVGGLIKDGNNESVVRFNTAPRAWYTKTALRRGKKMWDAMNDMRIKEGGLGIVKPKFHDYKVLLDQTMRDSTKILNCVDAGGHDVPAGEWVYSEYITEDVDWSNLGSNQNRDADGFGAYIVGDAHLTDLANGGTGNGWAYIGLIKSWVDSRAEPNNEPDRHTAGLLTDPLVNLFDESDSDDEVIANLRDHNDEHPYDEDSMLGYQTGTANVGRMLQRQSFAATQSGAGQIAPIPGFKALCGLTQVHITQGDGTGQVEFLIDVLPKGEAF
jgi:hypothetical protein